MCANNGETAVTYVTPRTLSDALDHLAQGARIVAGGTDFFPALGDRARPEDVLDVTGIEGMRGISRDHGGWRIGGATTWTDVVAADLPPAFDGLKLAAREVGSIQIQNAGTVAGNLCNASPAADGVPPLLTLDARVELTGPGGIRHLPLVEFLQGPRQTALAAGELLSAILVPDQPITAASHFLKLGARRYLVISIAMVSVLIVPDGGRVAEARIAVGSCSPVATRLPALEAALVGATLGDIAGAVAPEHFAPLSPIDDIRAPATYRLAAAQTLVRRTLAQMVEGMS